MKLSEATAATIFIEPEGDELVSLEYVRAAMNCGEDMTGLAVVVRDESFVHWAESMMRTHGHGTGKVNTILVEIDHLPPATAT